MIAEANRIFGYDCWDRQTLSPRCLWRETQRGETTCFYTAKVRITVRAGDAKSCARASEQVPADPARQKRRMKSPSRPRRRTRPNARWRPSAIPSGLRSTTRNNGASHGGSGIRQRPTTAISLPPTHEFELHYSAARTERFASAETFVAATLEAARTLPTVKSVFAFWEANLDNFAVLPRAAKSGDDEPMQVIGSALKERMRTLARGERNGERQNDVPATTTARPRQVLFRKEPTTERNSERENDASNQTEAPGQLAFPKEQRVRDKAHLAFVANEPCLVCGRRPAQAHHIRFAQPSALGLKVSDEFTVPLCNGHHDSLHHTGDERAWWARHGILDPLKLASRLWEASRRRKGVTKLETMASNGKLFTEPP